MPNFLDIIHHLSLIKNYNQTNEVSETGICLCHQVKLMLLGLTDRANPYLRSGDWAQQSRFYLAMETNSSLQNELQ
jgi:hypothetical protein